MKNFPTEKCPSEDSQSPSPAAWWESLTIDQCFEAASYCSSEEWLFIQNSSDLTSNAELKNNSITSNEQVYTVIIQ
ncbi:MAG: hypothetical protein K1X61_13365 [Chitinophagales bacterium]|nr:hypothetical protein [Chitinophagales bacterium]